MAKKIQLTIAEPCHENWDAMSPVDKGKFCGSCQKQVVDFSNMSDRQVAEFFKKPSTGSVCGRFMTDQLDRPMEIPRKRIPWLKYFFQIAIPAFLMSIKASGQRTPGQLNVTTVSTGVKDKPGYRTMGMVARPRNIPPVVTADTIITPVIPVKDPDLTVKGEIAVKQPVIEPICSPVIFGGVQAYDPVTTVVNKNEITGTVVDEKGEPIPFATVASANKRYGVAADMNGLFKIKRNLLGTDLVLHISSVGYEEKIIAVDPKSSTGTVKVVLKMSEPLPEVIVEIWYRYRRKTTSVGMVTSVIADTLFIADKINNAVMVKTDPPVKENVLLVYPNPAVSGSSVNISLKNPEEGYHQLQFVNQSGQMVRQQEVWIDAEARLLNTEIPIVAAGSYFMILTNKKTGKRYAERIIIQ
ncbi:MAG TPA: carboxypeptidase-like regulatory domain-containing protein [Chitinophagaceae bacterium]|jgi:hypothetical protein|nr:carboxypeptidase-like regulatory domain-containing protein [Chitinophagaceae bacterium]